MVETRPLGTTYRVAPQPPVVELTRVLPAGAVTFGVEHSDNAHVSIHVCGTDDGYEYVRFDLFDEGPHYHYVHRRDDGEVENQVIDFDVTANGDMLPWAITCLRTRLPEMLDAAGAGEVAEKLDMNLVDFVIDVVARTAGDALRA